MSEPPAPGVIVAAPASGSGKTTIAIGLIGALASTGRQVASVKVGPDYVDPAFHRAAGAAPCLNLDAWAMRQTTFADVVARVSSGVDLVVAEGVMGLYDGAVGDRASTADVAARTGWPVILVVDAGAMAASAAAVVHGFASFRDDVHLAGVVFNRVGGEAHLDILRTACAPLAVPVLGGLVRAPALAVPERHLGLVQAGEHPGLADFLACAVGSVRDALDVERVAALGQPPSGGSCAIDSVALPPPGQRIAVARDAAFGFVYEGVLASWRRAGAEVLTFSPLADDGPHAGADAVFLPGGYPELHAGRIAANRGFLDGLRAAARRGASVYGECGGYMALGRTLTDADGRAHAMAGLLPVETSFARPALAIGYREATLVADGPLGCAGEAFRGHEFHCARTVAEAGDEPLFRVRDVVGRDLGTSGCRAGPVAGSFVHLVDRAE